MLRWAEMKCQDVRRSLPLLVSGEVALTEWAILESHLNGCAECSKELGRLRLEATQRIQARRRQMTNTAAVAAIVVLVAAGIGWAFYQGSFLEISRLELFHRAPVESAPVGPEPDAGPSAPAPADTPAPPPARPSPVVRELPPAAAPAHSVPASMPSPPPPAPAAKPAAEILRPARPASPPAPAAEPARAARPSAPAPTALPGQAGEQMPTQAARPGTVVNAAPGAESMPTSQGSSRPASR
ncbi:MAG TPA: hypothetical protein VEH80_07750 [Candidatus Bathyarchaeia archaeon]|nr:hypothetical protein [Candidatus Bathyarchaeia archaeon]